MTESAAAPVSFYVPEATANPLPTDIGRYWRWVLSLETPYDGRFSWTLQTYLQLKEMGVPVSLATRLPTEGIIIAHRDFLPDRLQLPDRAILVVIKPDRLPHPQAHVHLVQSTSDPLFQHASEQLPVYLVPYWPQPELVPKSTADAARFERVAFLGNPEQLARELHSPAWSHRLKTELAVDWVIKGRDHWHDYSDVDAVVAVRHLGEKPRQMLPGLAYRDARVKPFAKLVNAWLAGVPAVLGREPPYQTLRTGPLDYLEVVSEDDIIAALGRLKAQPALRQMMREHGRRRATGYSVTALRELWGSLIRGPLTTVYERWLKDPQYRDDYRRMRQ